MTPDGLPLSEGPGTEGLPVSDGLGGACVGEALWLGDGVRDGFGVFEGVGLGV